MFVPSAQPPPGVRSQGTIRETKKSDPLTIFLKFFQNPETDFPTTDDSLGRSTSYKYYKAIYRTDLRPSRTDFFDEGFLKSFIHGYNMGPAYERPVDF